MYGMEDNFLRAIQATFFGSTAFKKAGGFQLIRDIRIKKKKFGKQLKNYSGTQIRRNKAGYLLAFFIEEFYKDPVIFLQYCYAWR